MSDVDEELCKEEVMALDGAIGFAAMVNNLRRLLRVSTESDKFPY
ncbi:hypothetical protein NVIE_025030 [Nitrososphaera viennensis EN76]|uniref:Uncharacterized protein n=1 Tax=Nitrososphaera viennensis EN76 TaxID=926571 RepID=A0A060HTI0_9ARCH|nr:hypothetical protein NVIE_025030 [Nitrososphaera viennensis EN76]